MMCVNLDLTCVDLDLMCVDLAITCVDLDITCVDFHCQLLVSTPLAAHSTISII